MSNVGGRDRIASDTPSHQSNKTHAGIRFPQRDAPVTAENVKVERFRVTVVNRGVRPRFPQEARVRS